MIGPSTYSAKASGFAGNIGWMRMQSFLRFASSKNGR